MMRAISGFFSTRQSKNDRETAPNSTDSNNFHEVMIVDDVPPKLSKSALEAKLSLVGLKSDTIPETREQKLARLRREALEFVAREQRDGSVAREQQDVSNAFGHIVEEMPITHTPQTQVLIITNRIQLGNAQVSSRDHATHSKEVINLDVTSPDKTLDPLGQLLTAEQIENNAREEEKVRQEAAERARREAEAKREEEERARALAEAERARREEEERAKALAAERARREEEERAAEAERVKALAEVAERARLAEVAETQNSTPKDDEQKQEILLNKLCNDILDNLDTEGIAEDLKNRIINELLEDFSSNQYYTTNYTTNSTTSNNTNDSTSKNQKLILPTRDPPPPEIYNARLTPKTYFGVGIQTQLVQEENQPSYLNITQFYDDSGFKSALKAKEPPIETHNQKIKITAIECDLDGNGTKAYSIDQIFENCGKDEKTFNLKLCAIFRNLNENELKLKFSTGEDSEAQDLNIKKSVFTKGENNEEYKNIKTVIKQQTVTRQQIQTQPSEAPSDPQNWGRPVDTKPAQSVVG